MPSRTQALQATVFILVTLTALSIYSLGWSGSFHFDDEANLSGLADYNQTRDLLTWISGGSAGPGGRSLALTSFLIDARNWPASPDAFLYTNTLIHIINALLLALVFLRLAAVTGVHEQHRPLIAFAAASLWLLLPLLVSSNLLVIQRMTTLAALFMFLGFYLYLIGRERLACGRSRGLVFVWIGAVGGTVLGFLTKENAALLPLLLLVTETTLLWRKRPPSTWPWRVSFLVLLLVPTALILAYLVHRVPGAAFSNRDFTLAERLATQTVVMFEYVRHLFIPRSIALTPFHDAYPIYSWTDAPVRLATSALVIIIGFATLFVRRLPLFSFGVFWFLGAHLIESTVIPLELYFEHRNYVPAVGPVFALVVTVYLIGRRYNVLRIVVVAGVAYLTVLALVLAQTTSLWGQPAVAGEIWYLESPASKRAANYLARQHIAAGDPDSALKVLSWTQEFQPDSAGLALQKFQLSCQVKGPDEQKEYRKQVFEAITNGEVDTGSLQVLQTLRRFALHEECPETLDLDVLEKLALLALGNPRLRGGRVSRANFYLFLAEHHMERRDLNSTMDALEKALAAVPDLSVLMLAMAVLNSANLEDAALSFAEDLPTPEHRNPLKKLHWYLSYQKLIDRQKLLIEAR